MAHQQVPEALALMAMSYEQDGCPIPAINCLVALVQQKLAADLEVKARLHLARLLLDHTDNSKEALQHLTRAVRLGGCTPRPRAAACLCSHCCTRVGFAPRRRALGHADCPACQTTRLNASWLSPAPRALRAPRSNSCATA